MLGRYGMFGGRLGGLSGLPVPPSNIRSILELRIQNKSVPIIDEIRSDDWLRDNGVVLASYKASGIPKEPDPVPAQETDTASKNKSKMLPIIAIGSGVSVLFLIVAMALKRQR